MKTESAYFNILSNIWKLNLIQAFRWFMLIMPVIVLFYKENGLSMQDIMVLQAFYSLALVVFEVPSGYFSDTIGRRNSLVAGSVLCTFGFFIYSFSYSFFGFLCAEMLLGLGYSLISGTDSALLYDTLLEAEREKDFIKKQGRLSATANFSEAAAGILGGIIVSVVASNWDSMYLMLVWAFFLGFAAFLTFWTEKKFPTVTEIERMTKTLAGIDNKVPTTGPTGCIECHPKE